MTHNCKDPLIPQNIPQTTTQRMIEVFTKLRIEMNGAVTGGMESLGVQYAMNYGVSSVKIKEIAKSYAPDHDLAQALWRQNIRETKLAAIYIEDPKSLTIDQMMRWIDESPNNEITLYCAMELFWKSHLLANELCNILVEEFIAFNFEEVPHSHVAEEYLRKISQRFSVAFRIMGRLIYHNQLSESETAEVIEHCKNQIQIVNSSESCAQFVVSAIDYFLTEAYKAFIPLREIILQLANEELKSQLPYC